MPCLVGLDSKHQQLICSMRHKWAINGCLASNEHTHPHQPPILVSSTDTAIARRKNVLEDKNCIVCRIRSKSAMIATFPVVFGEFAEWISLARFSRTGIPDINKSDQQIENQSESRLMAMVDNSLEAPKWKSKT